MNRKMARSRRGFTLVEMAISVAILATLLALAVPVLRTSNSRSREDRLRHDLAVARQAVEAFRADTGLYPNTITDLRLAPGAVTTGRNAAGATVTFDSGLYAGFYLRNVPLDIFSGSHFNYSVTSPTVGAVTSSATGNDSRGVPFSSY